MPDGKTHAGFTVLLGITVSAVGMNVSMAPDINTVLTVGILSGVIITPDLDLQTGCISQSLVRKHAGCIIGTAWSMLWYPYAAIVHHRSWLSHAPFIGTVLRLAYLALMAWIVTVILSRFGVHIPFINEIPGWLPWYAGGLALSDLVHIIMDKAEII